MIRNLRYTFENVNNWLRFAEAKNGVLATISAALTAGMLRVAPDQNVPLFFKQYAVTAICFLAVATVIALLSFYPKLRLDWWLKPGTPEPGDNLLFYGHIRKYSPQAFLAALHQATGAVQTGTQVERMLAEQVITNSDIAWRKYKVFQVALGTAIAGMIVPVGVALVLSRLS